VANSSPQLLQKCQFISRGALAMKKILAPLELIRFHRSVDSHPAYPKVAVDTICRKLGLVGGRKRKREMSCLELGAGAGNLTANLLQLSQGSFALTAIERDADLRRALNRSNQGAPSQEGVWKSKNRQAQHDLKDIKLAYEKATDRHHKEYLHVKHALQLATAGKDVQPGELSQLPVPSQRNRADMKAEFLVLSALPPLNSEGQYDAVIAGGGFR
jgi:hypothetical protein